MEKNAGKGLIITGYVFSILVCFIGLLIGVILISPNGKGGYTYDANSRRHGKIMIPVAVAVAVAFICFQMF